jgi:hypothetical protein
MPLTQPSFFGPRTLLLGEWTARLLQRVLQHILPSCRVEKRDSDGMLHEAGNAWRCSGRDQCANFVDLTVLERDRDFLSRPTENHTI